MTIEEILIDINEKPLRRSHYAHVLETVLKAFFARKQTIHLDMTGLEVLTLVYEHPDDTVKKQILEKKIGVVRSSDPYRNTVVAAAVLLVILAIGFAFLELHDTNLLVKYPDINPLILMLDSGGELAQDLIGDE